VVSGSCAPHPGTIGDDPRFTDLIAPADSAHLPPIINMLKGLLESTECSHTTPGAQGERAAAGEGRGPRHLRAVVLRRG